MRKPAMLIVAAAMLLPIGCAFDAPQGYVALDHAPWPYDFLAVSPEDSRFTIRSIDNEGDGSLAFWLKSVQNQLERNRGYRLRTAADTTTASGLRGKELVFDTSSKGVQYLYVVWIVPHRSGLFGTREMLYVAEAGGEARALEPELDALRAAVSKLR